VVLGGTAGANTVVVTGTGPVYTVTVSGMTKDGTVTVSIPAGAVTDPSSNANSASPVVTVTYLDGIGPNVQVINTSPETADHVLSNGEIVTFSITQFTVKFNQDVYNPAGDSDPKDVTNPNNYMLVRDLGDTAGLQTVTCSAGAVVPADTKIAVSAVTYDIATNTATFTVNSGLPLSNGDYNLFICGTTSIVDPINHDLALVGSSGQANSDFRRSFAINISDNGGGGNNNGGGTSGTSGNKGVTKPSLATTGALIPVTGFKPNAVTVLPIQPADKAYKPLDNIRIEIPTLGINFPIVGVMLNKDKWDLTWLQNSVGYLEGSAYPGYSGNTVLTAHVTDANNNLGPFSDIKGMHLGDKILIHAYGQIFVYEVQENTKILPSNISTVFKHEDYNWVTLVTCENYNAKTGLYTYRRMVRAILVSVVSEK
jgi:LPXTG-site transpeptidase (sortase) family protein